MSQTDRIEKDITLNAPPARVWRALADATEFGAWFGMELDGPFEPGRTLVGRITSPGYEHLKGTLVVEAVEPERRLAFRWHPNAVDPDKDYSAEPMTLVEFTIAPQGTGTRLQLVESGFDALPASRRDEAFRSNEGGWTGQMDNIRTYVGG